MSSEPGGAGPVHAVAGALRRVERAFLIGSPGATEVWLIRHADAYDGARFGDHDPPISETGRRQAARLAARLGRLGVAAVYSSPLRRARETAAALGCPPRLDDRLTEIEHRVTDGHLEFLEEPAEAARRMRAAISDAVAAHAGGRIVLVGHGVAILCYLGGLLGVEFPGLRLYANYTSVSQIRVQGELHVAGSLVDTAHLEAG